MTKVGGRRNYGYGKTLAWAGKNAIRERYGEGHFATRAAHCARWCRFAAFAKHRRIKDASQITAEMIAAYGHELTRRVQTRQMAVRYAQNLLSTVNVVLETMRGDRKLRVLPSAVAGRRDDVRRQSPRSLDRGRVDRVMAVLNQKGEQRVALIAALARNLGLRFREASLLDTKRALREALRDRRVNITEGTKGGRGKWVDRWIPVTPGTLSILQRAAVVQRDARSLIPAQQTFKAWRDHAYAVWRPLAKRHRLIGFHDLRAAYACERYEVLTGTPAPIISGSAPADRDKDRAARLVIAHELGHGRIDVLVAYIGKAG